MLDFLLGPLHQNRFRCRIGVENRAFDRGGIFGLLSKEFFQNQHGRLRIELHQGNALEIAVLTRQLGDDSVHLIMVRLDRIRDDIIGLRIHRQLHVGLAGKRRLQHVHRRGWVRTEKSVRFEIGRIDRNRRGCFAARLHIDLSGNVPQLLKFVRGSGGVNCVAKGICRKTEVFRRIDAIFEPHQGSGDGQYFVCADMF